MLVATLKLLFRRVGFERLKPAFIQICYVFASERNNARYMDLCNGTVSLQGPHVSVDRHRY